ncbi:MAG TPA: hypothetical protein PLN52_14695 [Opitutaceae bacterium]|nr:hypothetical protein [Opitutaceae bacterium]
MKPSHSDAWDRLVVLARQAPTRADDLPRVPPGFATRVVALGLSPVERGLASLFEPFAFRALSIASLVAVAAFALNVSPVMQSIRDEIVLVGSDPVSELVE